MKHYFQEIPSQTGWNGVKFRGAPRLIGRETGGCPVLVQTNVHRFDRNKGMPHRTTPGEVEDRIGAGMRQKKGVSWAGGRF